jgi:hypothetical protein
MPRFRITRTVTESQSCEIEAENHRAAFRENFDVGDSSYEWRGDRGHEFVADVKDASVTIEELNEAGEVVKRWVMDEDFDDDEED